MKKVVFIVRPGFSASFARGLESRDSPSRRLVPMYTQIALRIAGKTFITNAKELWGLEPAEVAGIVRKSLNTLLNYYFKLPVESATIKMMNADRAQILLGP